MLCRSPLSVPTWTGAHTWKTMYLTDGKLQQSLTLGHFGEEDSTALLTHYPSANIGSALWTGRFGLGLPLAARVVLTHETVRCVFICYVYVRGLISGSLAGKIDVRLDLSNHSCKTYSKVDGKKHKRKAKEDAKNRTNKNKKTVEHAYRLRGFFALSVEACTVNDAIHFTSRPYLVLSIASHPHSEVKPLRARIVRMWGTRSEVHVLRLLFSLSFVFVFLVNTMYRLYVNPPLCLLLCNTASNV